MITIEDWQARLILRVFNSARFGEIVPAIADQEMRDAEITRLFLERHVGTVTIPLVAKGGR